MLHFIHPFNRNVIWVRVGSSWTRPKNLKPRKLGSSVAQCIFLKYVSIPFFSCAPKIQTANVCDKISDKNRFSDEKNEKNDKSTIDSDTHVYNFLL